MSLNSPQPSLQSGAAETAAPKVSDKPCNWLGILAKQGWVRLDRLGLIALGALSLACGQTVETSQGYQRTAGATMGTQYSILSRCPGTEAGKISVTVEALLLAVNKTMSTYDRGSELSKLNNTPVGRPVVISDSLATVIEVAQQVSSASQGAFDITVGPLVELWGFGARKRTPGLPTDTQIEQALAEVGYRTLSLQQSPANQSSLRRTKQVRIDLSAIAKGYGVDELGRELSALGCTDYLVDIGGEVITKGINPQSKPWRVGVEVPTAIQRGVVQRVVVAPDKAVATSGDYRNFFAVDGVKYAHFISPKSGRPVQTLIASATVIHQSTMWADAWATALSAMPLDAALRLAKSANLDALLILRHPDDDDIEAESEFEERYTGNFQDFLD